MRKTTTNFNRKCYIKTTLDFCQLKAFHCILFIRQLVVGKMGRVGNLMITVEHRIYTGTAVTEIIKGAGTVDQRTLKHILYVEP